MLFFERVKEHIDRTSIVFSISGILFALGNWGYIVGATSKTSTGTFQYEAMSLLPGSLAFICFFILNTLLDRTILNDENFNYITGNDLRGQRFFTFLLIIGTMTAIAVAILMGSIRYAALGWNELAIGMIVQSTCIAISANVGLSNISFEMSNAISLADLAKHKKENDLWIAIQGKVYNVSKFLNEHPGGPEILMEQAGTDATRTFEDIGHSEFARELLSNYVIGTLEGYSERCNSACSKCQSNVFTKLKTVCDRRRVIAGVVGAFAVGALAYFLNYRHAFY